MNAIEVKISQIKNLNLIYLYNVDNVFRNSKLDKKYLGLKVVYDNNQEYISLDYESKEFSTFLKKIISVYGQEKDNRNIILLGNMSERLFQDDEITNLASKTEEYRDEGIGLFNTSNEVIRSFKPYLSEVFKQIIEHIRKMDGIEIVDINGFNTKYNVTYKVGGIKCEFPIILYFSAPNILNFKIGAIENETLGIAGSVTNNIDQVSTFWRENNGACFGYVIYDIKNNSVEKNITIKDEAIYHSTEKDTVTEEELSLVKFYLELFGINFSGEIMKTSENNFILGNRVIAASDDEAEVITDTGLQLSIEDKNVTLKYRVSNVINKIKHLINIPLDQEEYTILLRVKRVGEKNYIICELCESKNQGRKYDYSIFEIDDINLHKPFSINDTIEIDKQVKSYYDLEKRLLLNNKKQKNEGENE